MIYDSSYFKGSQPGGYTNYPETAYFQEAPCVKASRLLRTLRLKDPILVVGCAYGYLVEAFNNFKVVAYGLDISEYAINQAPPSIAGKLFCGCAASVFSYIDLCELADVDKFATVLSENMLCCLDDEQLIRFHTLAQSFGKRVVHIIEDRPMLSQWYNYKTLEELETILDCTNTTFSIQPKF